MKKRTWVAVGLSVGVLVANSAAYGQAKSAECAKPPEKVEGKVTRIDQGQNTITMQGPGGATYEFQASPETLKDYKVGDNIQAKLRTAPECKQPAP